MVTAHCWQGCQNLASHLEGAGESLMQWEGLQGTQSLLPVRGSADLGFCVS